MSDTARIVVASCVSAALSAVLVFFFLLQAPATPQLAPLAPQQALCQVDEVLCGGGPPPAYGPGGFVRPKVQ